MENINLLIQIEVTENSRKKSAIGFDRLAVMSLILITFVSSYCSLENCNIKINIENNSNKMIATEIYLRCILRFLLYRTFFFLLLIYYFIIDRLKTANGSPNFDMSIETATSFYLIFYAFFFIFAT